MATSIRTKLKRRADESSRVYRAFKRTLKHDMNDLHAKNGLRELDDKISSAFIRDSANASK